MNMRSTVARLPQRHPSIFQAVVERYWYCSSCPFAIPLFNQKQRFAFAESSIPTSVQIQSLLSFSAQANPNNNAVTETLEQNKRKAQELLNERIHPPGSYTASHDTEAKQVLDFFKSEKATDKDSVNLSISLIERIVAEKARSTDRAQSEWICNPRYYTPLLGLWKEAATRRAGDVIPPRALLEKLQKMSRTLPEFRYSIVPLNIVMELVIKEEGPRKAPFIAEELLNFVRDESAKSSTADLRPDEITYNNVIQAWAMSGLPQAPNKIEEVLQSMRADGIVPTEVTYAILLRYWAKRGAVDKIEEIFATTKGLSSLVTLSPAIYCYSMVGKIDKAEELFQKMIDEQPRNEYEARMFGECAQNILLAYRKIVDDTNTHYRWKERAVQKCEAFFEKLTQSAQMADEDHAKVNNTMMDIYVRAGMYDQAEKMSQRVQLNPVQLTILIRAFGKANEAYRTTALLHSVLAESRVRLDVQTFNAVINAWAESSRPDAVARAFAVLRLMNEDPKCIKYGIQPDTITCNSLLKCLSKSKSTDISKKAVDILDEMESRYQAGYKNVKPDSISFNLAIHTCLQAGDAERADLLMVRMEQSDTPPNIRTYNNILHYWATVGSPEAAERAEQILARMKQLAMTKKRPLKPDVFSYSIAMNAWSKSGHPDACERMWRLYDQMKEDGVEPNFPILTTLITFVTKSKKRNPIERADALLQQMIKSKRSDLVPDHRVFVPVIKGWVSLGDVENATRVLMRFAEVRNNEKNAEAKPSAEIIDYVTRAWIKSGDFVRATSLVDNIQALKDANLLPEGPMFNTYQSLLEAWVNSLHPEKAENIQKLGGRLAALKSNNHA